MKTNLENVFVLPDYTIRMVLEKLDKGGRGIVLAVDKDQRLIGTVTDGDIRRALLNGVTLNNSIKDIIHYNSVYAKIGTTREDIKDIFIKKQ